MSRLRRLVGAAVYRAVSPGIVLCAFRRLRVRRRVVVLMYHEVAEDGTGLDAWTVVRRSDFERQMDYLSAHYAVLGLGEALRRMTEDGIDEPACVITFDDGYAGNRDVLLPIVAARRLPVTVFVSTAWVLEQRLYWYDRLLVAWVGQGLHHVDLSCHGLGSYAVNFGQGAAQWREKERLLRDLKRLQPNERLAIVEEILAIRTDGSAPAVQSLAPLTIEGVRALAASPHVTIGAHSHCHNILTQLPPGELRRSIRRSKGLLEEWTERPVSHFSYPNGDYNADVLRAVAEVGFSCAMTTSPRPWAAGDSPYAVPRFGVGRYDSHELFKAKVSGACRYAHR